MIKTKYESFCFIYIPTYRKMCSWVELKNEILHLKKNGYVEENCVLEFTDCDSSYCCI